MAANEQELLSDNVIQNDPLLSVSEMKSIGLEHEPSQDDWKIANAQIAKLKAMGYEQVWHRCPDCNGEGKVLIGADEGIDCSICKGTGEIRKLIEWDREKVASQDYSRTAWRDLPEGDKKLYRKKADQLKETLI